MTVTFMLANILNGIDLPNESIQCVVTSPPYYGLKDYNVSGQLGLEPALKEYIENTIKWTREVKRVLKNDGTFWLNIGDSYAKKNREGLKPKDLMLIPHRVAIALQEDGSESPRTMQVVGRLISSITASYETRDQWPTKILQEIERLEKEWEDAHKDGWWVRSDIIWHKPNCWPESVKDRLTKSHEYILLLTKSKKYFYDIDAIREEHTSIHSGKYGKKRSLGFGHKGSDKRGKINQTEARENHKYSYLHPKGKNKRSVWTIPTKPYKGAHFATFPPKLPEICIKAGTSEKGVCPECGNQWERVISSSTKETINWQPACEHDREPIPATVLDPFGGSGTVAMVAQQLGRNSIYIDLNEEYMDLAKNRIETSIREQNTI